MWLLKVMKAWELTEHWAVVMSKTRFLDEASRAKLAILPWTVSLSGYVLKTTQIEEATLQAVPEWKQQSKLSERDRLLIDAHLLLSRITPPFSAFERSEGERAGKQKARPVLEFPSAHSQAISQHLTAESGRYWSRRAARKTLCARFDLCAQR